MGFFDKLSHRLGDFVDDITSPDQLREDLRRGSESLLAGEAAEAEDRLQRVVESDPGAFRAWHLLGLSQLRQEKLAASLRSLERARDLRPEEFSLLVSLAEVQRRTGQEDEALQTYRRALACRVDEHLLDQVFGGRGEIYLQRGDVDHAVRELRKAVAVTGGRDLRLLGLLGLAQAQGSDLELALATLSRAAVAQPPDREVLLRLARLLLDLGRADEARLAALRLLEAGPDSVARCLLARAAIARRDLEGARQELLRALGEDSRAVEVHWLLGRVHAEASDLPRALGHLRSAERLSRPAPDPAGLAPAPPRDGGTLGEALSSRRRERVELLRELLHLELDLEPTEELGEDAAALLSLEPDDPIGLAARAVATLSQPEQARELLVRSLARQETYAGQLGLGLLQLALGQAEPAAAALRAALRHRPTSARARSLLRLAHEALVGPDRPSAGETDFYPALRRLGALLHRHAPLADLAAEVTRIQEVFDRPLLVAVMGEFSSGKSTFVNALLGEDVAPMGVTPTTATINLLKYGERRGARVIWRDDREEMLEWSAVSPFLAGLDRGRAREVRLVEILYPSEELLRVNVVDTPGLNSLIDEHEETARAYLAQADAVIWLFAAHQAGKQTEQQALELIGQNRLKTVGVLNMIDRLAPEDIARVERHLREGFAGLVEDVVPISARQALAALLARDRAALEESRFPALRRLLEERLFARSRAIKRESCGQRLRAVLDQAEGRTAAILQGADRTLAALEVLRRAAGSALSADLFLEERELLLAALEVVYHRGAEEVLDFVRPRRWALGEHRASPADRDFLIDLLQDGLRQMGEASAARVASRLQQATQVIREGLSRAAEQDPSLAHLLHPEGPELLLRERLILLQQQVYTRYEAFSRGFLLGGRVDEFFARQLPRLELTQRPVYQALAEGRPGLEQELLSPLQRWLTGTSAAILSLLDRTAENVVLFRLELDQRLLSPLLGHRRLAQGNTPGAAAATPGP